MNDTEIQILIQKTKYFQKRSKTYLKRGKTAVAFAVIFAILFIILYDFFNNISASGLLLSLFIASVSLAIPLIIKSEDYNDKANLALIEIRCRGINIP